MDTDREDNRVEITLCMGSSCHSRGNRDNLALVREFLAARGLEERVSLKGRLCMENCRRGPVVEIGGIVHAGVDPVRLMDILNDLFPEEAS